MKCLPSLFCIAIFFFILLNKSANSIGVSTNRLHALARMTFDTYPTFIEEGTHSEDTLNIFIKNFYV